MKISEMIKNLIEIKKEHGDLELITSIDDEGNGFNHIYFDPSVGNYKYHEFDQDSDKINSCCVN